MGRWSQSQLRGGAGIRTSPSGFPLSPPEDSEWTSAPAGDQVISSVVTGTPPATGWAIQWQLNAGAWNQEGNVPVSVSPTLGPFSSGDEVDVRAAWFDDATSAQLSDYSDIKFNAIP